MRKLVSTGAAAAELGVSDKTIRRYIEAGRLPAYKVGPRNIRVDLDDVRALLQRVEPAA